MILCIVVYFNNLWKNIHFIFYYWLFIYKNRFFYLPKNKNTLTIKIVFIKYIFRSTKIGIIHENIFILKNIDILSLISIISYFKSSFVKTICFIFIILKFIIFWIIRENLIIFNILFINFIISKTFLFIFNQIILVYMLNNIFQCFQIL